MRAWYGNNWERFALPARATFRQVYFSPERRGANARADAAAVLAQLAGKPIDAPVATGDPFMLQSSYGDRSLEVVAKEFGPPFARAIAGVAPGAWTGPVESGYGWHLVFVDALTARQVPEFEAIEAEVKSAWVEDHRERTRTRLYASMRARYEVVMPVPR